MKNIKCPICEKTDLKYWCQRNGYKIYQCLSCTHRFANLEDREISHGDLDQFRKGITNGLMRSDQEYYDHLCGGEGDGLPTNITADYVLELCKENNIVDGSWLDIGCGAGYLLCRARDAGFSVRGIEPGGWGQIASARKNVDVTQGFLTQNTFAEHFGVISATDVVEHTSEPVQFLHLMADYLTPNGYAIISILFSESTEARLMGRHWNMIEPPTHCQFFTSKSLRVALGQAGLELISSRQYNIRYLLGLTRVRMMRKFIDKIFDGPQLVCLMKKY